MGHLKLLSGHRTIKKEEMKLIYKAYYEGKELVEKLCHRLGRTMQTSDQIGRTSQTGKQYEPNPTIVPSIISKAQQINKYLSWVDVNWL